MEQGSCWKERFTTGKVCFFCYLLSFIDLPATAHPAISRNTTRSVPLAGGWTACSSVFLPSSFFLLHGGIYLHESLDKLSWPLSFLGRVIWIVLLFQLSSSYFCHKSQPPDTLFLTFKTNRSLFFLQPGQKKGLWANLLSMFFLVRCLGEKVE